LWILYATSPSAPFSVCFIHTFTYSASSSWKRPLITFRPLIHYLNSQVSRLFSSSLGYRNIIFDAVHCLVMFKIHKK
jgi:hypothetical protein